MPHATTEKVLARVAALVACACVVAAAPARAGELNLDGEPIDDELEIELGPPTAVDLEPPRIKRFGGTSATAGRYVVRVRIVDQSPILVATLYWRYVGEHDWTPVPLEGKKSLFSAAVEVEAPFEYWIEVFDAPGNGPALEGSAKVPIRIDVVVPEAAKERRADPKKREQRRAPRPVVRRPEPVAPPAPPMPLARVLRVATARPFVPGRWALGLDGGFLSGGDFLVPGGELQGGTGAIRASFGLHPRVEVGVESGYRAASLETPRGAPYVAGSLGDLAATARTVLAPLGRFRFAFEGRLDLHAPVLDEVHLGASPTLLAAATFAHERVLVHANLGYRADHSENVTRGRWGTLTAFGMGVSRFDAVRAGLGLELPLGMIVPFAEYTLEVPVDRRRFASCDAPEAECPSTPPLLPARAFELPQRLGAGARLEIAGRLAIVLAAELSLTAAGSGLGAADERRPPAPEAYAVPAPFALHTAVVWQWGAPVAPATKAPTTDARTAPATTAAPTGETPAPATGPDPATSTPAPAIAPAAPAPQVAPDAAPQDPSPVATEPTTPVDSPVEPAPETKPEGTPAPAASAAPEPVPAPTASTPEITP